VATCGFGVWFWGRESRGAPRDSPSIPHSYLPYSRSPVSYPRSGVPNRIHASGFTTAYHLGITLIAFMDPHQPCVKSHPIPAFPLWGRGATGRKSQPATSIHASTSNTRTVPQQPIAVSGVVANPWPSGDGLWTMAIEAMVEVTPWRPLARTAEWIVFRGNAHPVVAVAHRIGHPRQFTPTAM
jgi:hypothetical protein